MKITNLHSYYHATAYRNEDLIKVYQDTLIRASNYPFGKTQLVDETYKIHIPLKSHYERKAGVVFVENIDSVGALVKYGDNTNVAILNMASAKTPGGGVMYGSKAQEEALFRCSNLGLSISREYYPLDINQALITENVVFFKDMNYFDLEHGHKASVITCAAPKLQDNDLEWYRDDYEAIIDMKIELILNAALKVDATVLILGAWGCGVYKNDPNFIAKRFKEHLEKDNRRFCYDKVIFAVINDHNSVGNNYEIFKTVLDGSLETSDRVS